MSVNTLNRMPHKIDRPRAVMETEFLIGQGRFPAVAFFTSTTGVTGMSCAITGEPVAPV